METLITSDHWRLVNTFINLWPYRYASQTVHNIFWSEIVDRLSFWGCPNHQILFYCKKATKATRIELHQLKNPIQFNSLHFLEQSHSLRHLTIDDCSFPLEMTFLASLNLKSLCLTKNFQLGNGILSELSKLTTLNSLKTVFTLGINTEEMASFKILTKLETLTIRIAQHCEEGLNHLSNCLNLTELSMTRANNLLPASIRFFQSLSNLHTLNLSSFIDSRNAGIIEVLTPLKLRSLSLRRCSLDPPDSRALRNLTTLTNLQIQDCRGIDDNGLASIGHLENLRALTFSDSDKTCGSSGYYRWSRLTQLTQFNISGNLSFGAQEFGGIAEREYQVFRKMIFVDLSKTKSDEIWWARFDYIEYLDVSHVLVDYDSIGSIALLCTLKILKMDSCGLHNREIRRLEHLSSLVELRLNSNMFTNPTIKLTNLEKLFISHNKIGDQNFVEMCNQTGLKNLKVLEIRSTSLSWHGFQFITKLSSLEQIDFSLKSTLITIASFQPLTMLTSLSLIHQTQMRDSDLKLLKNHTNLKTIHLGAPLTGKGFSFINNLPLQTIHINACAGLTIEGMQQIANFTSLKFLQLTRITNELLEPFRDGTLRNLVISLQGIQRYITTEQLNQFIFETGIIVKSNDRSLHLPTK